MWAPFGRVLRRAELILLPFNFKSSSNNNNNNGVRTLTAVVHSLARAGPGSTLVMEPAAQGDDPLRRREVDEPNAPIEPSEPSAHSSVGVYADVGFANDEMTGGEASWTETPAEHAARPAASYAVTSALWRADGDEPMVGEELKELELTLVHLAPPRVAAVGEDVRPACSSSP